MRKAVFITGFNNWGKSTIIFDLFNRRRFLHHWWYEINGINARFTVESHSNDDLWGDGWRDLVQLRVDNETEAGLHLFTALCPTLHDTNDFRQWLGSTPFDRYDEMHVLLIEYKYEHHARLMIDNIIAAGRNIPRIHFHVIDADVNLVVPEERSSAKMTQIRGTLQRIFP